MQEGSIDERRAAPSRGGAERRIVWLGAAIALYLVSVWMTAHRWEFSHDEGVTWEQAIGALPLATDPEPAGPFSGLRPWLEGSRPLDPSAVVARLRERGGMHPPLYYLGFAAWVRVAGGSAWAIALPALVAGIGVLLLAGALARRLSPGPDAPAGAALLLASSPWFVAFTIYARPYAWVLALCTAATWAALRSAAAIVPHPGPAGLERWRWPALWVLLSVAGLYSLYHYAFVVLWHGIFLGWVAMRSAGEHRASALARVLAMGGLVLAAFAPWLGELALHLDETSVRPWYFTHFLPLSDWPARAWQTFRFFALGLAEHSAPLQVAAGLLGGLTAVLALASFRGAAWRALTADARALWVSALALPLGIGISDAVLATHTLFLSKILFPCALLFALLALRAAALLPRRAGQALVAAWISLQLAACAVTLVELGRESPLEATARAIAARDGPAHRVVVSTTLHGYAQSLARALDGAGLRSAEIVHVPGGRLAGYVKRAAGEPGLERLTLVNLGAFYTHGDMWTQSMVEGALAQARHAGLQLVALDGATPAEGRVLAYSLPLQVRYFSK